MINRKDVITIKVPFPNISSDLATMSHMYICKNKVGSRHELVKCQSFKPYMLLRQDIACYIDEEANPNRNPFRHKTRIDCDKIFVTTNVEYDSKLRAKSNICEDLANLIDEKVLNTSPSYYSLNEDDLISLNHLIKKII